MKRLWSAIARRDSLADPPGGIGGELVTAGVVEAVDSPHQAGVALLDQVQEAHAAIAVAFGDGNRQSQVGSRQIGPGGLVFLLRRAMSRSRRRSAGGIQRVCINAPVPFRVPSRGRACRGLAFTPFSSLLSSSIRWEIRLTPATIGIRCCRRMVILPRAHGLGVSRPSAAVLPGGESGAGRPFSMARRSRSGSLPARLGARLRRVSSIPGSGVFPPPGMPASRRRDRPAGFPGKPDRATPRLPATRAQLRGFPGTAACGSRRVLGQGHLVAVTQKGIRLISRK